MFLTSFDFPNFIFLALKIHAPYKYFNSHPAGRIRKNRRMNFAEYSGSTWGNSPHKLNNNFCPDYPRMMGCSPNLFQRRMILIYSRCPLSFWNRESFTRRRLGYDKRKFSRSVHSSESVSLHIILGWRESSIHVATMDDCVKTIYIFVWFSFSFLYMHSMLTFSTNCIG